MQFVSTTVIGAEISLGTLPSTSVTSTPVTMAGYTFPVYQSTPIPNTFPGYTDIRTEYVGSTGINWAYFALMEGTHVAGLGLTDNILSIVTVVTTDGSQPQAPVVNPNYYSDYSGNDIWIPFNILRYTSSDTFPIFGGGCGNTETHYYGKPISTQSVAILETNHLCYRDLVSGYELDPRTIPDNPEIIPVVTETITIKYYRQNKFESIPDLKTICWFYYKCNLVKDVPYTLPIVDCVLGTLYCDSSDVLNAVASIPTIAGKYAWSDLLPAAIPGLFANWQALFDATNTNPAGSPVFPQSIVLHKLAANNDVWNNTNLLANNDIGVDLTHPMFIVDDVRSTDWHLTLQPLDDGIGTLMVDSPRLREIHAALNAGKYAINELDPTTPRVPNLGHLIDRTASLLGYRPLADGTFTKADEIPKVRTVIGSKKELDKTKVGVNNFGSEGMVMRRLNNRFEGDKITAEECVLIYDIPQLLAEYQDQINLSLGLQESSAIEIKTKNETARYPNQLAVMMELLNLAKSSHDVIRSALVSSMIAQAQSSEIISALGLPTVTKVIPVQIDNKVAQIPYQGAAPHRSISQEIATCTANVGIVLGQLI